jgi:DNA-binding MarR family transcriptional regulator
MRRRHSIPGGIPLRIKKIHPTPEQLSEPEHAAMIFIEDYRAQKRKAPSTREISAVIGLSVSATHDLVRRLIDYGYLAPYPGRKRRARNIRLIRSVRP